MTTSKYLKLLIENVRHIAPDKSNYWLSSKTGIGESSLSRIFNETQNPNLETIVKIAKALHVEPADLLSEKKEKDIPADILHLLENQSDTVYETIRTMLHALNQQQKKQAK